MRSTTAEMITRELALGIGRVVDPLPERDVGLAICGAHELIGDGRKRAAPESKVELRDDVDALADAAPVSDRAGQRDRRNATDTHHPVREVRRAGIE